MGKTAGIINMEQYFTTETIIEIKEFLAKEGLDWALNILAALAIFVIGRWVGNRLVSLIQKGMKRANVDPTLVSFIGNILSVLVLVFVVIAAISKLGVETTSLAAIFAAAGLAIGLSLQNSLSNLAAGVMIITFRPFKVGDFVQAAGEMGTVSEVSIFTTKLNTPDNKRIILPNGQIIDRAITNFSANDTRKIDITFGIGYGDDIKKAKDILQQMLENDERVLQDPAPQVVVKNLGESSVDLAVRPWVKSSDYWPVTFDLLENVKLKFDEEGISIPFPQRDLHVIQTNAA